MGLQVHWRQPLLLMLSLRLLLLQPVVAALGLGPQPSCKDWPNVCPGLVPRAPYKQTWQMNLSTIVQACNYNGYTDPKTIRGWGIVEFDWSNGKGRGKADGWAKHKPMDNEEMLFKQVQMSAKETPGTTVWVYRNAVYGYPWFTDVRKILEDPAYADWFIKFKPQGPWFSAKCDKAQPTLCSDFYHSQEQSPGYPHGDGDCAAPGCDCGKVPCGFYVFNHSTTTVVRGQTFRDWFINSYMLNEVGRSPLVSGFFWDDVWNEQCNIHDQVKGTCIDMGFNCTPGGARGPPKSCNDQRLVQLTQDFQANMAALRDAVLDAGKFAWQFMWTGGPETSIGATSLKPIVHRKSCAADLRAMCQATHPAQTRAMAYGLNGNPSKPSELQNDLVNFLLTRSAYSWLGWGWAGCGKSYYWPPEFDVDYGEPLGKGEDGLCKETAPGSQIFVREYTKATVQMDCVHWNGTIQSRSLPAAAAAPQPASVSVVHV